MEIRNLGNKKSKEILMKTIMRIEKSQRKKWRKMPNLGEGKIIKSEKFPILENK